MAVNFHQPSVYALFDAMPAPLLTFAVSGLVTYANVAAKQHPGRPVETMGGNQTIKALVAAATLGKVKLPYTAKIELADGHHLAGQFMAGPAGLDVAFLAQTEQDGAVAIGPKPGNMRLKNIIELLRDEMGPPMHLLLQQLQALPRSPLGSALEQSADALNQRLMRLADLVDVFGNDILETDDRIEPVSLLRHACEELAPRAEKMGVRFDIVEPRQTLPPIYGNQKLITRAFHECLENALVHSRKEVSSGQLLAVEIRFTLSGEHVLVSIRNRGASTLKVVGQDALRPFVTAGANETVPRLGLPLVQRIVGLHGGNMRLSSVDEDTVQVLMEFPTGAPLRGQDALGITQAQRYARDLAQLMSRRKKEKA
jgi:signal transduction histidine kinase